MSSLWTPGGEHAVPREQAEPAAEDAGDQGELTEEQAEAAAALAAELDAARQRVAEVPAATIVANHAMGLFELGAIHLSRQPPDLAEAAVAIDAMAAVVEVLGERLGPNAGVLRDALSQIQMAFVQVRGQAEAG